MKLLVFTQKVDSKDSILGFFHGWIRELAKGAESVSVICLWKGDLDLPKNVTVYSLGKERGVSLLGYIKNFYHYLFLIRGSYDRVFVHMNQEYILLGGLYWKLIGIPVYMWRNHPAGSIMTRIAVLFSTKVFCTSPQSFTARFKKTILMPVGVDTNTYRPKEGVIRKKYSVLVLGRIAPIKRIELALHAVNTLVSSGAQISMAIIGSPTPKDAWYYNNLKAYVAKHHLSGHISFVPGVSPDKTSEIYSSHEVYLNLTLSGSFDKTIVEAVSCGAIPLVLNHSLEELLPEVCITEPTSEAISRSVQRLFGPHEQIMIQSKLKSFAESQSLIALMDKLSRELK